jgi:hypothetical protein
MTHAEGPRVVVILEARLEDLLNGLRVLLPKLLNERLLCDLHRETERLLRHHEPGDYEGGRPCADSAPTVRSANRNSSHPADASNVIAITASAGNASERS